MSEGKKREGITGTRKRREKEEEERKRRVTEQVKELKVGKTEKRSEGRREWRKNGGIEEKYRK